MASGNALALLIDDSLRLWGVDGRATADGAGVRIAAAGATLAVRAADPAARPVRWLLDDGAGRPDACPSVVVLLRLLRDRLGGDRRAARALRVGAAG
ncbi:MAG: hypothetical protein IT561_05150 [Alphaproteobacteria bacterium]|nr:hypothetical protein [Alphaproteobacteria bacterium]